MAWNIFSFLASTSQLENPPDVELGGITSTPRHRWRNLEPLAWSPIEQLDYHFATHKKKNHFPIEFFEPNFRLNNTSINWSKPSRHKLSICSLAVTILSSSIFLFWILQTFLDQYHQSGLKATTGLIKTQLDKTGDP